MKKLLILLMTLALCALSATAALCDEAAPTVCVSITDDTGALVLAREAVRLTDADGDGTLTINDALICAHEAHPDGAAAYATAETEFGLSMMKLWGVENGGSYGYYLNDASAWSLLDPVKDGDHVKAYAFTDLTGFTDTYSYFDASYVETAVGTEVTLTLQAAAFDENFAPVTLPVAGAAIIVDGEMTEIITDAEGKAVLTFDEAGAYLISADSGAINLVAPVCIVQAQ